MSDGGAVVVGRLYYLLPTRFQCINTTKKPHIWQWRCVSRPILPLAGDSYVGNEASAESPCYLRENSRCPRSLKVVSFFVRGVVEVSSPIHQSAHRAAHYAMELERHGAPPRIAAAALALHLPGIRGEKLK